MAEEQIYEIHGARVARADMRPDQGKQAVTVQDKKGGVVLALSSTDPALLTPEEARMIAACLIASAKRVSAKQVEEAANG